MEETNQKVFYCRICGQKEVMKRKDQKYCKEHKGNKFHVLLNTRNRNDYCYGGAFV